MQAAETLDLPEVYVVAHLMALWTWALDNAPDGVLPSSPRIIAKAAQWTGEPNMLINALFDAGFLETDEARAENVHRTCDARAGTIIIHDWHSYAGRLIEKRESNTERMRRARALSAPAPELSAPAPEYAPEKARAESVHRTCDARAGATVPNSTVPNSTVQNSTEQNSTEQNSTEQNKVQESAPVRAKRTQKPAPVFLSPPSLTEVKQFCMEQDWPELAEEALDYQTQRGWMMKSGAVVDWPAALRTWKRNHDRFTALDRTSRPARASQQNELDLSPEARRDRTLAAIRGM